MGKKNDALRPVFNETSQPAFNQADHETGQTALIDFTSADAENSGSPVVKYKGETYRVEWTAPPPPDLGNSAIKFYSVAEDAEKEAERHGGDNSLLGGEVVLGSMMGSKYKFNNPPRHTVFIDRSCAPPCVKYRGTTFPVTWLKVCNCLP